MSELDLARVAKLLGVAGSSHHDGEAVNAIRVVDRMLREAGMRWPDLTEGHQQAEIATEAAAVLLAEITALKAELDEMRSTGIAVAVWQEVDAAIASTRTAAEWGLDLHRNGIIWLSPDFEVPFLTRCTTWTGRLTPRMQLIFQRIMDRIVERTGMSPPP